MMGKGVSLIHQIVNSSLVGVYTRLLRHSLMEAFRFVFNKGDSLCFSAAIRHHLVCEPGCYVSAVE